MKKLMFALATAASFAALAIESDIVGYASSTLDKDGGASITGAQFINCGSDEAIKLADLIPVAANNTDLAYSVEIQTLDNAGRTADSYMWNGKSWDGDNNTTFAAGTGLWVFNDVGDADTVGLQSSGKVADKDILVTLDKDGGAVAVVNPFPVKVALSDLAPYCETMSLADLAYSVEIQTLDNAGRTAASYVWNGNSWDNDDNTEFDAGAGLWVFNDVGASPEVSLRIPAPEL